jgi:hypothetical protein
VALTGSGIADINVVSPLIAASQANGMPACFASADLSSRRTVEGWM